MGLAAWDAAARCWQALRCWLVALGVLVAAAVQWSRGADGESLYYYAAFQDCRLPEAQQAAAEGAAGELATVHVAYSSDARGFVGLLPSMLSLSRHLREPERCAIHLIVAEADMARAEDLAGCFRRELSGLRALPALHLHRLRPRVPVSLSTEKLAQHHRTELLSPSNFARFYLHEYLPAAPRALWLDHDTIVRADVAPLYRSPMRHAVAAAPRHGFRATLDYVFAKHPTLGGGTPGARAFNPGVLLVDLERWRADSMTRSVEHWAQALFDDWDSANESTKEFRAPDPTQSPINLACAGAFDSIDWRWNVVNLGLGPPHVQVRVPSLCLREARVLHWNGHHKPWRGHRPQYRHLFEPYVPLQRCGAWQ